MNKFTISAVFLSVMAISGCAVKNDITKFDGLGLTYQSNVSQLSDGTYFTEVEASPAAGRSPGAIGQATRNAADYCKAKGKTMKEIKMEAKSHALVNGVAKLQFECI